jgi:hypothetical protein
MMTSGALFFEKRRPFSAHNKKTPGISQMVKRKAGVLSSDAEQRAYFLLPYEGIN